MVVFVLRFQPCSEQEGFFCVCVFEARRCFSSGITLPLSFCRLEASKLVAAACVFSLAHSLHSGEIANYKKQAMSPVPSFFLSLLLFCD